MYLSLGRVEPAPRVATETPGPVAPMSLQRVLDTTTSEFRAVCRIYTKTKGGHSIGSGVLITPNHVLTCGHVIFPPQNPDVRSIRVFVAQNGPTAESQSIAASGWAVKEGWTGNCCRTWDEDYGIIRLSKSVPTPPWSIASFDPRRLVGKAAYLAGYPSRTDDLDAKFMYRSRGPIDGTVQIQTCVGGRAVETTPQPTIDDTTRLVAHRLHTAPVMSGGPLWSFIDNQRVLWGLHQGASVDGKLKRAILLNEKVRARIAEWISRGVSTR